MSNLIFDLLFPVDHASTIRDVNVIHCMINALHHAAQSDQRGEKSGYLSTVQLVKNGRINMQTNVIRTYTPSTKDGVIIPFNCKID